MGAPTLTYAQLLVWAPSALARHDKDVERRLRLWMADCAARVLHIYERAETSEAPRNAIIAARQFARGEIDDAAWAAARDAAWGAALAACNAACDAACDAAWAAALAAVAAAWAAGDAAEDAARAAWDAARAAWDAARAAGDDAGDAEEAWQLDRLVAWMSDVEPADWPLPARHKKDAA